MNSDENKFKDYLGKSLIVISFLVLILMVGLIIQKPFLHIDEWFTRGLLYTSFNDMITLTANDVHPPLYYITVILPVVILNSLNISYDTVFVMKMMSVIPYIVLIIISATKIRKDYSWLTAGIFSLTLITMSGFFSNYSIARMYPLGLLLVVISVICAGEILKQSKLKYWILLVIFSLAGAYTHYFVAVSCVAIYLILFIHLLLENKSEIKNWFVSVIIGIIGYSPWVIILYRQMSHVHESFWIKELTIEKCFQFFGSIFTTTSDFTFNIILTAIFAMFLITLLIYYKNSPKDYEFELFSVLVFIATVLFGIIASVVFKPILVERYLIPSFALVWLSVSIFISKFDLKKVIIPFVILLLLFSAFNVYDQIEDISQNHDTLVKNEAFLDNLNNNDSVFIISSKVKYVHFNNELNDSIIYSGFSVDKKEDGEYFAKIYGNEEYKFLIPDDLDKYSDKNIYITYKKSDKLDLPSYVSLKEVGKVENCIFAKLTKN